MKKLFAKGVHLMKIRLHSPNLVRILFLIALVIPLAMSELSPARASALTIPAAFLHSASQLYAAEPQTGIDCGCNATGTYRAPIASAPLSIQPQASPHGKYQVVWQYGSGQITSLSVIRTSDSHEIVSLSALPSSTFWGFSSDDDRFALYSIRTINTVSQTTYYLYNLVRATDPGSPIWDTITSLVDTEAAFSPRGHYFQYAWVDSGTTYLIILDARTGTQVYETNFTAAPPPGGGKTRIASWGYSPDGFDRTFVYAYVNSQIGSSVYWGVVNLAAGTLIHDEMLVNAISSQTIQPFWKFSPCGDAIGLVNTAVTPTNIQLFATKDSTSLKPGGLDITTSSTLALKNNLTSHYAETGSATYALAENTADLACSVTPGAPGLKSLSISPASVRGGVGAQGTVTLNQPAPSGGVIVSLASDTSAAQVPSSVNVPYGNSSATFTITTSEVSAETSAYISATLGSTTNTATLTITPSPTVSLTMSHYGIIAGATETATVTLSDPAPAGGAVVYLSAIGSFHTLNWVRVPEGETSATFEVTANLYVVSPEATLTASYLNASKTIDLTILRASSLVVTPAEVRGGMDTLALTVGLSGSAPQGGIAVPLSGNPAGIVNLPLSLTIASGQTTGSITASTTAIDENTDVTILAGMPDDSESPTATVHVLATLPTALPGGPYIVLAGQPVTLIGTGTDPSGESLTFAWDLDFDETFETAGDTTVFTNTTGQNREVPIGFRACNTSGRCGTAQTFVWVRNPGQVWASGPEPSQDIGMPNSEIGIPGGPTPAVIEGFGQVIDVVGGAGFVAALRADGTVWTMGDNFYGQLGDASLPTGQRPDGHRAASNVPVPADIDHVVAIASDGEHMMALKQDGTVWTWGSNRYLTLGNGTADWNPHPTPTRVENLSGVVAIAADNFTSFALTRKGEIYGWGYGDSIYGRACGDTALPCRITTIPQAVALQVTSDWAIVLKRDGTVWFWGGYDPVTMEDRLDPEQIEGLSGITAINASGKGFDSALLALKNDGTVWGFGSNNDGQLGQDPSIEYPPYLRDYIGPLQIPGLTAARVIASGDALQSALRSDGTVAGWGLAAHNCPTGCGEYWLPSPLAGLANVQAIAVGDDFRLAIIPTTDLPAAPDLVITQIADQETVSSGDPIGFTITTTNNGDGIANSVTLTDTLPIGTGLSWSVGGTDGAACTITAGVVSCNFSDMAPGAVKTIRLTSPTPNASGTCSNLTISNTATVVASNQPEGRSATASITVLCPRAYADIWADTSSVVVGDPVNYTITIGNMGDGTARDVFVDTTLANNPGLSWSITDIIPASAASNCTLDSSGMYPELLCSFDQMNPQQEVVITVTSPTTAASCGTLSSGGYISSGNGGANRFRPAFITVNCTVDLAITQAADQETVSTGDPVGFTIEVTNNGNGIANAVTLTDTLPTAGELSWSVSGTDAAACTITAGVVSCNFGDMSPGTVKTIRLTSPTQFLGGKGFCPIIGSTATVMASNQPEGRSATASTTILCPSVYIEELADNQDGQNIPAGDPVSFTTKFGNTGQGIARDVLAEIALPTNPGLSWSISSITPAEAANNCVFGTDRFGTYELICSFDQMMPSQEVTVTLTSPTTSASCGTVNSVGYISLSNGAWVRFIMKPPTITCTVSATVQPGEAATLTLLDGRGQIDFPADLVTLPTTFIYTEQDAPSQALGSDTFAGLSFTLVATDPVGNPVTSFPASYTIQLTYQDSDWQDAGIADQSLLNLAYWDTAAGQWVNVLPCNGCSRDTEQNRLEVILNHLTEFALIGSIATDAEPPTTSASVSPEANASGWYAGPVTVTLSASDSDSGVQSTEYNLNGSGWTTYSAPFIVSTESTSSTVHNTLQYRSTDNASNVEETKSLTIQIDTTAPTVGASAPLSGNAVQGKIKFGVTLNDPLSGAAGAMLSIREADGASGKEIGYEDLTAVYNSTSGNWQLAQPFDTTQLPDGFYVLVATGKDVAGNEKTEIIPFSIRNWAVLELLPSTENNKAGRTMPVKFSLRVVQEVDPAQPFVYSEELTIRIYQAGKPTPVLQSSTFGSGTTDYRINAAQQVYITNFQTLKKPMQYTVEILRDALSIGTFGFQTTK
jgi:uncharacterized repeat protein (TIGR01451 family)